ncbi:zinc finger (C2H2 type) family protein [Artemisia annua]|uniref:Zinc finger (C2H2 type) family protein n=1 Tax=Artemisia annua TaxID=35608 RepID=A0A2U1NRJ4_ARTAN|nr:zinc finger (C2H2 type) family protein [Artemisia annua]
MYLGCFIIFPTSRHHHHRPKQPSPSPFLHISTTKHKRHKHVYSSWSFLKRIFTNSTKCAASTKGCEFKSRHLVDIQKEISLIQCENHLTTRPGSDPSPMHKEIHPCPNCGEIFHNPGLLQEHQSIKHALCELLDDDPGKNVVQIIFESGWTGTKYPTIHRVMKIHNSQKVLACFEEYRENIKLTSARHRHDPRCIADGNELLRFHCTTFLCDLGQNGNATICTQQYCNLCGIIGSGFSPKLDGISTLSNSYGGHVSVPDDIEEEFGFMNVKRAMLVCRVIAGRVGCDPEIGDKNDPGYDSLVVRESSVVQTRLDDVDELIVFDPRAVLPCFVIVYTV